MIRTFGGHTKDLALVFPAVIDCVKKFRRSAAGNISDFARDQRNYRFFVFIEVCEKAKSFTACALIFTFTITRIGFAMAGTTPVLGVNAVNIGWLSPDDRSAVVSEIATRGVSNVRMSTPKPVEDSLAAMKLAQSHGLHILAILSVTGKDEYPPGTPKRSGGGKVNDEYPLSLIDLNLFRASTAKMLDKIDAAGIKVDAFELGNEINWADFNGDLPVSETSSTDGPETYDENTVRQGAANYVKMVAILRKLLTYSRLNANAKIISAGLADVSSAHAAKLGASFMPGKDYMTLLRQDGLDQYVDAYGAHFYASPTENGSTLSKEFHTALSYCATGTKPCWITEWGIAEPQRGCPDNDDVRAYAASFLMNLFKNDTKYHIAAVYTFTWHGDSVFSVWRCGQLTEGGKIMTGGSRSN